MHRLILAALLFSAATVHAQPEASGEARVLTFEEAVGLALERNTQVRRARVATELAAVDVRERRAAFLPILSASGGPTQRYGLSFDNTSGTLASQTTEAFDARLSASVNLFNGFRDRRALDGAQESLRAQRLTADRTEQSVVYEVAALYLQVLLDDRLVGIRAEALEAERALLAQTEGLIRAGVRPRVDLLTQEARVAEAELAVLDARSAAEVSQTRLVGLLHLDPFGTYAFAAPDLDTAAPSDLSLGPLLDAALAQRSDLSAQDAAIRAAEESVSVARGARLPSVDLFASYGTGYSSLQQRLISGTDDQFEQTPLFDQLGDNRSGSLGLSVSFPILDQRGTGSRIERAQLRVEDQRLERERLRHAVAVDVRQALVDLRTAQERVTVTAVQTEAAAAALAAETERYRLGATTLAELAQARARAVQAQSEQARARFTVHFRRALLGYTLGQSPSLD